MEIAIFLPFCFRFDTGPQLPSKLQKYLSGNRVCVFSCSIYRTWSGCVVYVRKKSLEKTGVIIFSRIKILMWITVTSLTSLTIWKENGSDDKIHKTWLRIVKLVNFYSFFSMSYEQIFFFYGCKLSIYEIK